MLGIVKLYKRHFMLDTEGKKRNKKQKLQMLRIIFGRGPTARMSINGQNSNLSNTMDLSRS